jgi:hypothetical protein
MLYFKSQNKKADRGEKVLQGHIGELPFEHFWTSLTSQDSGILFDRLGEVSESVRVVESGCEGDFCCYHQ